MKIISLTVQCECLGNVGDPVSLVCRAILADKEISYRADRSHPRFPADCPAHGSTCSRSCRDNRSPSMLCKSYRRCREGPRGCMSDAERALAYVLERKRAYQQACGSETTALFMADLASFCRADRTCFNADARLHALAEGRREVWLRIQEHLTLTPEHLVERYGGPTKPQGDDDNG